MFVIFLQLAVMMNKVEDVLMEILDEKCSKNEALPAYKTAQGLTFQIITKTAFAMDVDCQRNENVSVACHAWQGRFSAVAIKNSA